MVYVSVFILILYAGVGCSLKFLGHLMRREDGWIMSVTLYNDTYYMCEFDTEERLNDIKNMSTREKHMTYWGHKCMNSTSHQVCIMHG